MWPPTGAQVKTPLTELLIQVDRETGVLTHLGHAGWGRRSDMRACLGPKSPDFWPAPDKAKKRGSGIDHWPENPTWLPFATPA